MKLQVFTKICLDTNTYYVKLRVCWSRKVIILSNVNIYGRQHISNSSWWAVNFDPRLEEILQASVPCLLERESPILLASSFILCEEENVKYPVVNDVLDDSDVVMMITGTGGSSCVNVALIIVSLDVTSVTGSRRANNTATILTSLTRSPHTSWTWNQAGDSFSYYKAGESSIYIFVQWKIIFSAATLVPFLYFKKPNLHNDILFLNRCRRSSDTSLIHQGALTWRFDNGSGVVGEVAVCCVCASASSSWFQVLYLHLSIIWCICSLHPLAKFMSYLL